MADVPLQRNAAPLPEAVEVNILRLPQAGNCSRARHLTLNSALLDTLWATRSPSQVARTKSPRNATVLPPARL